VDIDSDGVRVLSGLQAISFRQDLKDAGIGDGTHAWGTGTPVSLKDGEPHVLDARHSANGASLGTSPKTLQCGPKIAWIQPAEAAGFGPSGTFTVAGYAYGGSGNVQLVWRDATIGGPWTVVDYLAPVNSGVWYNTIGPAPVNECHKYDAYAIYDGGTSKVITYDASTSGYCKESASIIWMQPQPRAGFGPANSLIVAGSATGAPSDVQVYLYYHDLTAGTGWSQVSYAPLPDSTGIWYNSFPADYTHQYEAYVKYDIRQSRTCVYAGNNDIVWCP
jgi:hypothetical protein